MKKIFFLFCFVLAMQPAFTQGYNNPDKEYGDIATQALSQVSPATREWFNTTIQKHPAGNFDSTWAKKQLYSKFTGSQMNEFGELFIVMMAYLKLDQKKALEDRKMQRSSTENSLASRENKSLQDNKNIDQQKSEATEKYNKSMSAATTQLTTGVISGTTQLSSHLDQNVMKTNRVNTSPGSLKVNAADSLKSVKQMTNDNKVPKGQSRNRRRASLNNIQKSLDILQNMNPKL